MFSICFILCFSICDKLKLQNLITKMGNNGSSLIQSKFSNPFYASNSDKDSQVNLVLSDFDLISVYQDALFKRCSVLEHKQTRELIVAKQIDCKDQTEMNKMYDEFNKRKQTLVHDNLVRLRLALKKKTDGMFNDQYKILLFFDYILVDLQSEYQSRKQKKAPFSADQINIIMTGAIRGYAALQALKIPNDKVRLNNIYFGLTQSKQSITKVIDTNLFPDSKNLQVIRNRQKVEGVYLAPQQLRFIPGGQCKSQKAGVYSLGICLLQLCLLQASAGMYNYANKSINYAQLQTRLNIIKNKYPLSVFYVIRQMLERNDDSRLSFTQLAEKLPTSVKMLPQSINLSVMKQTQTKFGSQTKIKNPIMQSRLISPSILHKSDRKMQSTTLASEYRPIADSRQVYTNHNQYIGQKKDNLRHGKGKYIYSDDSYYYGDWFKGKMEGYGQLYDCDQNLQYEGEWKNDHFEGKGKLFNFEQSGDWLKYQGQFRSGMKQGFGQIFYKNGTKYKGQFRNDKMWGKGRLYNKSGDVQKAGIWQKSVYISEY